MPLVSVRVLSGIRLDPVIESTTPMGEDVNLVQGTYAAGTILGERTLTPGTFAPYASSKTDGSQIPSLVLKYSVDIGVDGHATQPEVRVNWPIPQNLVCVPAYKSGVYKVADLTGLDQNAIDKLGRLIGSERIMLHGAGKSRRRRNERRNENWT